MEVTSSTSVSLLAQAGSILTPTRFNLYNEHSNGACCMEARQTTVSATIVLPDDQLVPLGTEKINFQYQIAIYHVSLPAPYKKSMRHSTASDCCRGVKPMNYSSGLMSWMSTLDLPRSKNPCSACEKSLICCRIETDDLRVSGLLGRAVGEHLLRQHVVGDDMADLGQLVKEEEP